MEKPIIKMTNEQKRRCIEISNEYLKERGYEPHGYDIPEHVKDMNTFWKEKGLKQQIRFNLGTHCETIGFEEDVRADCLFRWYMIIVGEDYKFPPLLLSDLFRNQNANYYLKTLFLDPDKNP